jgi:hypothetical protein
MIFSKPVPFEEALQAQQVKSILPTTASSTELMKLAPEIRERARFSARVVNKQFLERIDDVTTRLTSPETVIDRATGIRRAAKPGEYMDPATARLELKKTLDEIGYQPDPAKRGTLQDLSSDARLDLIIRTNTEMAQGYGDWKQGQDPAILDMWPAQELVRVETRQEKRDWLRRWLNAGGKLYNGRMMALKNDPIWTAISAFGQPYPPFDFNSGMGVRDIERDEAVSLGLIDRDTQIAPHERPFNAELSVSPKERGDRLFEALAETVSDMATVIDGVLQMRGSGGA